jgi:hypothetical protein
MRLFSRSTAIPAAVGGFVLITAVAACTVFGGSGSPGARTGSDTSSGASAGSSASGGDGLTWLPSGGVAAASPDGADAATLAPGQTRGPQSTVAPRSSATAGATHDPGATPAPTATIQPASPTPKPPSGGPCYVFPSSNVWNQRVDGLSVASNSAAMVGAIGAGDYLHPDFDAIGDGIPYNIVDTSTPTYNVSFQYADESDPGPYPIPANPRIEGGSDRHLLLLDLGQCKLWELYAASKSGSSWSAGSGAIFDLRSNALRPAGWTSADAAGLPIFPGLVRYAEVLTGSIEHAIRFTAPDTCGYIYPARHPTADPCSNLPPMGLRLRLKASVNISSFGPNAQIVLTALKRYGMILADNGSPWYISGVPDSRWNDDEFHVLQTLHGTDFEVVNTSGLRNG